MNNNIKLGALGFNFGTLDAIKANRTGASICGHSIQGQIKPHSGYGVLGSIHFFPRPLKGKWSLLSGLVENLGVVGIFFKQL